MCIALGADHTIHVIEATSYMYNDVFIAALPEEIVKIYSSDSHFLVVGSEKNLYCFSTVHLRRRGNNLLPVLQIGINGKEVVNVTTTHPSRVFVLYGRERYSINNVFCLSDVDFVLN
jgi:hypothetical protein